jgi:hypothetical protein
MSIRSDLTTLREIANTGLSFNVPIYQRLYVWGSDQIDTLLEDLLTAFQQQKQFFYLGGTLVVERQDNAPGTCFDLIDGQQRFTTLWMMSLVWQECLTPFLSIPQENGHRPRVAFSIRPEVDAFFARQLRADETGEPGNPRIDDALASIRSFRERFATLTDGGDRPLAFSDFTRFVFEKVQLVLTRVPAHTDLNKLFEVINNRGVQLQHHEILKAKFLHFLSGDSGERDRYATLWDTCAHMGNYVEKNLRDIGRIRIAELFDNESAKLGEESLSSANKVLAALHHLHQNEADADPLDLLAVLALPNVAENPPDGTDTETYEAREVRSIVTFPMLLQHTLRIWLARHQRPDLPRILDKELLHLFSDHFLTPAISSDDVRSFIKLLWETRYVFDKHIIKWVSDGVEEHHLVCRLYLNTSGKSRSLQRPRPDSNQPLALLQSMLYHSQQITTHYWLTPLLAYLLNHPGEDPLPYLRHLDNHLLCSSDGRSLAERSNDFLRNPDHAPGLVDIAAVLSKPDGLGFPHYWFYKLEFVLWDTNHLDLQADQLSSFRMTAKNSIEHISPQTPQELRGGEYLDRDKVSPETLDTFGNLALVSRSLNSEYGNKPYNEKQPHFSNRNRGRIDSMKMAAIYRSLTWGDEQAGEHQKEMIVILRNYFVKLASPADPGEA